MTDVTQSPRLRTSAQQAALRTATRAQLASYDAHVHVRAARIKEIKIGYCEVRDRNATLLIPEDPRLAPIEVTKGFVSKYDPEAPGYFLVDSNGQEGWCSVGVFERDFVLTEEASPQDIQAILSAADPEAATAAAPAA